MGGNVSISRNRTKIERLLDWKEFTSKSVGRFSFQCLTEIASAGADEMQSYVAFHLVLHCLTKYLFNGIQYEKD